MSTTLADQIDTLARRMRPMPAWTGLGVLLPPTILLVGALAWVYDRERTKILKLSEGAAITDDPEVAKQLDYIRQHETRLKVPKILSLTLLVLLALFAVWMMLPF